MSKPALNRLLDAIPVTRTSHISNSIMPTTTPNAPGIAKNAIIANMNIIVVITGFSLIVYSLLIVVVVVVICSSAIDLNVLHVLYILCLLFCN